MNTWQTASARPDQAAELTSLAPQPANTSLAAAGLAGDRGIAVRASTGAGWIIKDGSAAAASPALASPVCSRTLRCRRGTAPRACLSPGLVRPHRLRADLKAGADPLADRPGRPAAEPGVAPSFARVSRGTLREPPAGARVSAPQGRDDEDDQQLGLHDYFGRRGRPCLTRHDTARGRGVRRVRVSLY